MKNKEGNKGRFNKVQCPCECRSQCDYTAATHDSPGAPLRDRYTVEQAQTPSHHPPRLMFHPMWLDSLKLSGVGFLQSVFAWQWLKEVLPGMPGATRRGTLGTRGTCAGAEPPFQVKVSTRVPTGSQKYELHFSDVTNCSRDAGLFCSENGLIGVNSCPVIRDAR